MGTPCSVNSHTLYNAKKSPQKMEMPEGGLSRHQFSAETLETLYLEFVGFFLCTSTAVERK